MKRRRVKITGIGPVTPAGIGRASFERGILEPISRAKVLNRFPDEAGAFVGMEVKEFKLEHYLPNFPAKRQPRHTQFALAGTTLALRDAGIPMEELCGKSPLILVGASLMDFGSINKGVELIVRKGPIHALPTTVFTASVSSIGGAIAEAIGGITRGLALQSACCAGMDAIGQAADMIACGESDIAICGGTEAPLYFHPMIELKLAGLAPGNPEHPERQCRPFDLWRTTGVIGEGACMFILEPEASPRTGYAYVEGYSFASDPPARPGTGLSQAIELALANAGMHATEIDTINAWGPGHRIIDAAEAGALRQIFNRRLADIPTFSIKGAIGSPLGAGGAIQVAATALGLQSGAIPPTVNWQYPDPECPLNLNSKARHIGHGTALINSHGLSGTNACLVLKR